MYRTARLASVVAIAVACACNTGAQRTQVPLNEVPPTPASITGDPCAFKGLTAICLTVRNRMNKADLSPEVWEAIRRAVPGATACAQQEGRTLHIEYEPVESMYGPKAAATVFATFRVRDGGHTVAEAWWSTIRSDPRDFLPLFELELSQLNQGTHWPNRCVVPGAT